MFQVRSLLLALLATGLIASGARAEVKTADQATMAVSAVVLGGCLVSVIAPAPAGVRVGCPNAVPYSVRTRDAGEAPIGSRSAGINVIEVDY